MKEAMSSQSVVSAFREGRIVGPVGPLRARSALLTRRSLLLFTGDTVLKLRRPLRLGEVDQRTLPKRLYGAERERFIGRQLTPAAFLDDCSLTWSDEGYELLPGVLRGEPIVPMWRQDPALRADNLAIEGALDIERLRPFLIAVATFHEGAPLERSEEGYGAPGRIRARWEQVVAALDPSAEGAPIAAAELARLDEQTRAWLERAEGTLAHRVSEGRIRDLHLGLRLDHIYLGDPIAVFDPDERPEEFHWSDTAEDLALFAVELDALGYAELAAEALDTYAGMTYDRTLRWVTPLFKRLVALRRAADLWSEAREDPLDERGEAFAKARLFATLALGIELGS